jgi:hypothetical protein
MGQQFARLDAAENAFFERQLEFVRAKSYDVKYPGFKARELVPVDNSVDPGAETVKYNQYDSRGLAKVISSYADDLPRADVLVKEFRQPIKSLGASYGYNVQEIRAARMAGLPLEQRKANAARLAVEQRIEKIAASGDTNNQLNGFLSLSNTLSYTIPNGAAASPLWTNKTGLEIVDDMMKAANVIVTTTNGVEIPDTIVVPLAQYGIIATKPLQSGVQVTVLQYFLANSPYIKSVVGWFRCTGAGSGATDRMVVYRRDPDALQLVIPQEFEQFPPEQDGLEFKVACHARIGGVVAYYPFSILYADGI